MLSSYSSTADILCPRSSLRKREYNIHIVAVAQPKYRKRFCNLHVVFPEKKSKPSTYRAQITTSRLLKNSYLMSF